MEFRRYSLIPWRAILFLPDFALKFTTMRIHPIAIFLLLFPMSGFSQATPYYLGGGTVGFADDQLKQDLLYVQYTQTGDSLLVSPSPLRWGDGSTYRKVRNANFMKRVAQFGSPPVNYVWVDAKSIMILQYDGNYLIFLKDHAAAQQMGKVVDRPEVLAFRDSIKAVIEETNQAKTEAKTARSKLILNTYAANLRSVRDDPTLQKDMIKWAKIPGTTAYIMDNGYQIVRSYTGQVLNKNITGIIKFKQNGKCYIQWRDFGYECLGDGKFSTDLTIFNRSGYTIKATSPQGALSLQEGVSYEIDCN
jgi:hypothetical protein